MKSEHKAVEEKKPEITYPCLKRLKGYPVIVLFRTSKEGMVVFSKLKDSYPVGHYNDSFNSSMWELLPTEDTITISN